MSDNPYQTPSQSSMGGPVVPPPTPPAVQYSYLPLKTLCRVLVTCLCIMAPLQVAMFGVAEYVMSLVRESQSVSGYRTAESIQTLSFLLLAAVAVMLIVYLVAIVATCMFMYRANANLRAFGAERLRFTPGWCAGWWFVPVANLIMPYSAMKEIYLCSRRPDQSYWAAAGGAGIVGAWWAAWVIGNLADRLSTRASLNLPEAVVFFAGLTAVACSAVAAVLLIFIVKEITELQQAFVLAGEISKSNVSQPVMPDA